MAPSLLHTTVIPWPQSAAQALPSTSAPTESHSDPPLPMLIPVLQSPCVIISQSFFVCPYSWSFTCPILSLIIQSTVIIFHPIISPYLSFCPLLTKVHDPTYSHHLTFPQKKHSFSIKIAAVIGAIAGITILSTLILGILYFRRCKQPLYGHGTTTQFDMERPNATKSHMLANDHTLTAPPRPSLLLEPNDKQ
jgi:hypothetical protein